MEVKNVKVEVLDNISSEESVTDDSKKSLRKAFLKKAKRWASATWIPEKFGDEKEFLEQAYQEIGENNKNNPGSLGEYLVKRKLISLDKSLKNKILKNIRIDCVSWLPGQKHIKPDLVIGDTVIEVKTLRYFNSDMKRGNQGTAVEKIDSIPRKYGGVYKSTGKRTLVVLVADQQIEKVGKSWIDAFKGKYHGNDDFFKAQIELCKKLHIKLVSFNELTLEDLKEENQKDTKMEEESDEISNELNMNKIVKTLSALNLGNKNCKFLETDI